VHFTWDISLGQLILTVPLGAIFIMLRAMFTMMTRFRMEHEILMRDWSERTGKPLEDLPTRKNVWW